MTAPVPPPPPPPPPGRGPVWGDEPRRPGLPGVLADTTAVLLTALRLLGRHWPVLLAIFIGGVLARELAMRAAIQASLVRAELGTLVLLLAPMATLAALVLMLRTVRPSLPALAGQGPPPPLLEHLGSVLIPFLTLYYFEDYLYEDIRAYDGRVTLDEIGRTWGQVEAADQPSRLPYELSLTMLAVVAVAIVARWLLSRWRTSQRHRWLGIPGAYLELVWLTLVYLAFFEISERIIGWGNDRRLVRAVSTGWDEAVGALAGLTSPFQGLTDWYSGQLGGVNAVLVVPVAWLAVGAVVLGHQPAARLDRVADRAGGRQLYQHATRRWSAAPRAVRWATAKITTDLRGRFTPLAQGARMLIRGGAVPMLLFCLAFVAARRIEDWLWELQRLVVGPRDLDTWLMISWPLEQVNRAVTYTVVVCLLAAAVEQALRARAASIQSTGSRA